MLVTRRCMSRDGAAELQPVYAVAAWTAWGASDYSAGRMSQPQHHEPILRSGVARLHLDFEVIGGKLMLTDRRLFFQPHNFLVSSPDAPMEIPLMEIRSLRLAWTKLFWLVPWFPNSMAILTSGGQEYRFELFGRRGWRSAISAQAKAAGAHLLDY